MYLHNAEDLVSVGGLVDVSENWALSSLDGLDSLTSVSMHMYSVSMHCTEGSTVVLHGGAPWSSCFVSCAFACLASQLALGSRWVHGNYGGQEQQ